MIRPTTGVPPGTELEIELLIPLRYACRRLLTPLPAPTGLKADGTVTIPTAKLGDPPTVKPTVLETTADITLPLI
ncbi:hypothetical protein GCM10010909_02540 [Acidocella aquatica]|uniref:Uncharacterized protein n=1 Tax=Acidocella aquatica TaxID=1922313 RepID=A0ABQ6A198_9PROT|nr:hypothetical protein GCM10010909_02540 [Acidocella aquatica]